MPKALEWRQRYEATRRHYLDPLGQEILDLRLNLTLHFLQKHTLWMYLYRCPLYNPMEFLSPLFSIASSWLSSAPTPIDIEQVVLPQQWKGCFKFQYGLAITALFEFLRFCSNKTICEKLVVDLVCQYCRKILNASSDQVPVIDLGMTVFANM